MTDSVSKVIDEIKDLFVKLVILVLALVLAAISFFWYLVLYITPEAPINRDAQGLYLVNTSNFNHWHTYSTLLGSPANSIKLDDELLIRSIAKVDTSCAGIANCDRYRSKFYTLNENNRDVFVILKKDDDTFSNYARDLKNNVERHNELITNFDVEVDFNEPDFPEIFNYKVSKLNGTHKVDVTHDKKIDFANARCRVNGIGCSVEAIGSFSIIGFPNISFKVR